MKIFKTLFILFTFLFFSINLSFTILVQASEVKTVTTYSNGTKITITYSNGIKVTTITKAPTTSNANTTKKPVATTTKPNANTTAKPSNTTTKPNANTTAKPSNTTTKPNANTTAKPSNTTTKPNANTTAKPSNTATTPNTNTTAKPSTTSNVNTTIAPSNTSNINTTSEAPKTPDVNTTKPVEPLTGNAPTQNNVQYVALTFDDGPSANLTPKLLDALDSYNAKATFFLVGNMAYNSKNIVNRIYKSGHEIGNHSYNHSDLTTLYTDTVENEIKQTSDLIMSATGAYPTLLRPPYGAYDGTVSNICASYNLPLIMWDVDTLDWKYRDVDYVYNTIENNLKDGSIILLHDIHATTVEAAIRILRDYSNNGYKFVTVSQLAAIKGISLQPGNAYFNLK